MPTLNIKPTHKPIKNYYAELREYDSIGAEHEGAVRTAFQNLLQHYCRQADLILVCEKTHDTPEKRRITPDGEIVDTFGLPYGYSEAKDTHDNLTERQNNPRFQKAFTNFHEQCQTSINPNLSIAAVEEMLIQHLLTERIFRTVFNNPDFTRRNIIAREIENVIDALTSQTFDRNQFLQSLDPFYVAIEQTAAKTSPIGR